MAEIKVEIRTSITYANGEADSFRTTRDFRVGENMRFMEDECDKALAATVEAQRENLAGRWSRVRG